MQREARRGANGRRERERGGERGVDAAVSDVAEESAETLRERGKVAGRGGSARGARAWGRRDCRGSRIAAARRART